MDSRLATIGLCCLVLFGLAGCATVVEQAETLAGDGEHPFADETVSVAVDGTERERDLVSDGLAYWEDNAAEYAGFEVAFRVVEAGSTPAGGPDVRLRFVETVAACGDTDYPAGCAPRLNASTGVDRPASVEIQRGLADESTRVVVRHEVGHLLGLTHTDRPRDVMAHESDLATLPQPDATERGNPWNDSTLTIAIDGDSETRERYRDSLTYALEYVREGADGAVPEAVSVSVVEDPAVADIVVRPVRSDDCTVGSGSCLRIEGTDPDRDGAIEGYTRAEIRLVDLDIDAASWHIASQFVDTFHTGDDPDRLDEASQRERRGAWHG